MNFADLAAHRFVESQSRIVAIRNVEIAVIHAPFQHFCQRRAHQETADASAFACRCDVEMVDIWRRLVPHSDNANGIASILGHHNEVAIF